MISAFQCPFRPWISQPFWWHRRVYWACLRPRDPAGWSCWVNPPNWTSHVMLVSSQNLDLSPIQWVVPQVANKFWELRAIHAKNHCIQQTSTKTVPLFKWEIQIHRLSGSFRWLTITWEKYRSLDSFGQFVTLGKDMVSHAVPNMIQAASPSTALCM